MQINIPLSDVHTFLSNRYKVKVGLKNIEKGSIEVNYLVAIVLSVKQVTEDEITFRYKANGLVNLMARGADFFWGKNLHDSPVEWDAKACEVTISLKKIEPIRNLLAYFSISELLFENESIVVAFSMKEND